MNVDTSSPEFFEAKYRSEADPWKFADSPYELERYAATVRALGEQRYHRAFEPGCSVGVLTEKLASLCGEVVAIDFSPSAVAEASRRCRDLANVQISCRSLTDERLPESFDLLVLSEIGYYFSTEEWRRIAKRLIGSMPVGGTVLAVHWLGSSPDHRVSGDEVHAVLLAMNEMRVTHSERHTGFRLDRWERV